MRGGQYIKKKGITNGRDVGKYIHTLLVGV